MAEKKMSKSRMKSKVAKSGGSTLVIPGEVAAVNDEGSSPSKGEDSAQVSPELLPSPNQDHSPQPQDDKKKSARKAAKAPTAKKVKAPKREISETQRRHGRRYADLISALDRSEPFEVEQAIALLQQTVTTKFDSSLELHIRLGIDMRQADQQVRGTIALPAGTGKTLRVAAIAPLDKQAEAKAAGADLVGEDDLIKQIEEGKAAFDLVVATPEVMGKVGRLGRVLGTKGLMPNPKSGTVTADIGKTVKEIKVGRIEFRSDKDGIVHAAFGKASFGDADLLANLKALLSAIMQAKPSGAKGTYVRSIYVSSSMGPSFRLDQKVLSHLSD